VRFWDASAVVPLVAWEKETANCRKLLAEDTEILVWFLTPVEVEFRKSKEQLAQLERRWSEVILAEKVRERARRLLEIHPLRAADSLQLAAALIACEENPQSLFFVTLDRRLKDAAEKEGFGVLGM